MVQVCLENKNEFCFFYILLIVADWVSCANQIVCSGGSPIAIVKSLLCSELFTYKTKICLVTIE